VVDAILKERFTDKEYDELRAKQLTLEVRGGGGGVTLTAGGQ
jgi:hypothetical protein